MENDSKNETPEPSPIAAPETAPAAVRPAQAEIIPAAAPEITPAAVPPPADAPVSEAEPDPVPPAEIEAASAPAYEAAPDITPPDKLSAAGAAAPEKAPAAVRPPKTKAIPIIAVKDLSVIYNQGKPNEVVSLDGASLEIFPEEYVIIFGPSGCGKSTLLYSIAGLQKPTNGSVLVDQDDVSAYKNKEIAQYHRQKIGMIFQSFYLISTLTVLENVCLPTVFSGKKMKEIRAKAVELLKRYQILNQANKFPSELSGGQKQRVAVARSLMNNPEIILADEPVGNLDSKAAHVVMTIFRELNEMEKKTIVLVTHDPAHLKYGNKIVHMIDGKIVRVELKRKRDPNVDSYIFQEGKVIGGMTQRGYVSGEYIPTNFRLLMRSFKGLSSDRVGNLLVPFKAQQIFNHLFFSMTNDQIERAMKKLESFLYFKDSFHNFFDQLDLPVEQGGAGWDKRLAKKFSDHAKQLVYQAGKIDFFNKGKSAAELAGYVNSRLDLKLDEETLKKLARIILDRLGNYIGRDEFIKLLDLPEKKHGLGLNRRIVEKISKEIELLLLLRY